MKTREQVEEKYKWDLSGYFKDMEDWNKSFEELKSMHIKLMEFEGKLNDDNCLYEMLVLSEKSSVLVEQLAVYIYLKVDEDTKNNYYNNISNKLSKYLDDISPKLSFIDSELSEISDDRLLSLASQERFKDYDLILKDVIINKPHQLSKEQEKLLATVSECVGGAGDVFGMLNNADIKFEDVTDENGNKLPLNNSNYNVYASSTDRKLRESAKRNLCKSYGNLNFTLGENYMNNVKVDCTYAKIRKFNSAFENAMFDEKVDCKVYNTLIEQVNKNANVFYRYYELKRKTLKYDEIWNYDIFAPIGVTNPKKYSYDEAFDVVTNSLNVLGEDYINILNKAKTQRWIDVMPNENKRTGAYSSGAYSKNPVVLMNFEGTDECVSTLGHELGHMMHTYYSLNNPSTKADYKIFVAEVASTVNEILISRYLIDNSNNNQEKLFYIDGLMFILQSTLYRQTMFAEFEYNVHKAYEDGEDTTTQAINNMYKTLLDKYFGKNVKLIDELTYEWSIVPHFYNSFYVYKYATGIISALSIVNKILTKQENAVENYKKFLASGSTKDPVELLKIAGADLTDKSTFENAFNFATDLLNQWENILNNN